MKIVEIQIDDLTRLFNAIQWNLNPYIGYYSDDQIADEYPHIDELQKSLTDLCENNDIEWE